MTYPPHQPQATDRMRPSARQQPPAEVVDVLLWRLAIDVAAAHRTDHDGNCTNLACAGQRGPCTAARNAARALYLACQTPKPGPHSRTAAAIGRATVTNASKRFIGWFTAVAVPPNHTSRWQPSNALAA